MAEIRALPPARKKRRHFGLARGRFTVPESFFEPLPDEVVASFEAGRVRPPEWEGSGIRDVRIDEPAVMQLPRLPPLHADPFDRILISQAIEHGLTLLTPDRLISQYPVRLSW